MHWTLEKERLQLVRDAGTLVAALSRSSNILQIYSIHEFFVYNSILFYKGVKWSFFRSSLEFAVNSRGRRHTERNDPLESRNIPFDSNFDMLK